MKKENTNHLEGYEDGLSLQMMDKDSNAINSVNRRDWWKDFVQKGSSGIISFLLSSTSIATNAMETTTLPKINNNNDYKRKLEGGQVEVMTDPESYSYLIYTPNGYWKKKEETSNYYVGEKKPRPKYPILVVLHGAGTNHNDSSIRNNSEIDNNNYSVLWEDLALDTGEHSGLPMNLLVQGRAPKSLSEKFIVVSPYAPSQRPLFKDSPKEGGSNDSHNTRSFYNESRAKILQLVLHVQNNYDVDPKDVYLWGFSDGATVAVELATTRKFQACILAAYGFTGTLPSLALQRLTGIPFWVFHSADDVIFPVKCSDNLVRSLRSTNNNNSRNSDDNIIRYTRFHQDQEGMANTSLQGHSVGITAAKQSEPYEWLFSIHTNALNNNNNNNKI